MMLAGAIQKTPCACELTLELQRTPSEPRTATLTVRISSLAITNQALRECQASMFDSWGRITSHA
jgi:hypothetical protein